MAKKAAEVYIHINKKITKLIVIHAITEMSHDWGVSATDVCHRLICEGALKYKAQKKEQPVPHFEVHKK
jgi:hypothetical protein